MIHSAMLFALGVFVSGLVWLAFSVALVRRARRLTERRLLASLATRRAEFEAERDELRARHAVQMHRQEREVSRILDMATARSLEADIKERDLVSVRAELNARGEEIEELRQGLTEQRNALGDAERRNAESGTVLRATQHALKMEHNRRTALQTSLDQAEVVSEDRRVELTALRAENAALRAALDASPPAVLETARAARAAAAEAAAPAVAEPVQSASVVPLRARTAPAEPPDQVAALVAEAARDLQRMGAEVQTEPGVSGWRATASAGAAQPAAPPQPLETNVVADLDARRSSVSGGGNAGGNSGNGESGGARPAPDAASERRFFEALAEIRALKRAASQAGE